MLLNDWNITPVIKKKNILNFDFLNQKGYIKEIKDSYYYITKDLKMVEIELCKKKASDLAQEIGIKSVDTEIKSFIKRLNQYNELKDVAQALLGRIADLRGTTIKEVHREFEVPEE